MADIEGWSRRVFRVRQLPGRVSDRPAAAALLSNALSLPTDHITIFSLATTSDRLEDPPSKVATLQLKSVPKCLEGANARKGSEWSIPVPGSGEPSEVFILDTHFKGFTVLSSPISEEHRFDCIAISGLASHPFGSWQPHGPDKSFMWIRDAIPLSVPGLRTMTYGYDASLSHSNSFQSIGDIAQTLVLLLRFGGWNLPSSKPIIFLAHSLGGLVLKEAIVRMADRDKAFFGILDNISGVIMFGVPSSGMHQSHLMAMVEDQPTELLVQDLSREGGAYYLRDLNKRFEGVSFLQTKKVFWAYETRESPTVVKLADGAWSRTGPPAVLVNVESATSHYCRKDQLTTFPINEDHSNMVKFSRGDPNLGLVTQIIVDFCALDGHSGCRAGTSIDVPKNNAVGLNVLGPEVDLANTSEGLPETKMLDELGGLLQAVEDIHHQLHFEELDLRIQQIEDPFQDTFEWAFGLPVLTNWLQQGFDSSLFWIHGKPGSGKSTFMKFLFQNPRTWQLLHDWKNDDACEIPAGFFFHYRGNAIQKSFEGVLRSLIIQILSPHSKKYRDRHHHTWTQYQLNKKQYDGTKNEISKLIAVLKNTEKLKEDTQEEIRHLQDKTSRSQAIHRSSQEDFARLHRLRDSLSRLKTTFAKNEARLSLQLAQLDSTKEILQELAKRFEEDDDPVTRTFLAKVVADFRKPDSGLILKLERTVRRLLDQDVIRIDLILFFDALDEFDGHPDVICRFLKDLVDGSDSPQSKTRVKICLSSRPWKALQDHFSAHPQLALEIHTRGDIEDYVSRSVKNWHRTNLYASQLVPAILSRANGVFLWVRLAVKVLSDSLTLDGKVSTLEQLEMRLRELPDDLFEFYRLIIERIGRSDRRRTYALLELLSRHSPSGPPVTTIQIRDAVLVSDCTNFQEVEDILDAAQATKNRASQATAATADLATWGGGLVEIKRDRPQLMHQTVLEFIMGLDFKSIVLGDLADFLSENGHSFYVKQPRHDWIGGNDINNDHNPGDIDGFEAMQHLAYHGEQAEITTGNSQFDYLHSVPFMWSKSSTIGNWGGSEKVFMFTIASCGLTLCLRDWIARNGGNLARLTGGWGHEKMDFPLLSAIFFSPPWGVFHDRYMKVFHLLLENGFHVSADRRFFPMLCSAIWDAGFHKRDAIEPIPQSVLLEAATLVLQHGQDPNVQVDLVLIDTLNSGRGSFTVARPLHVGLPALAVQVLLHKDADVNCRDRGGLTALDWLLDFPAHMKMPDAWNWKQRYEMCNILIEAGGQISENASRRRCLQSMAGFDKNGYDTAPLREKLGNIEWTEDPSSPEVALKRKRTG
ncbi:hypothetical protein B0T16DRAFT_492873 [Cercophora newfieldiana]|uniref:Nephrocystin 3-like N-terminal domain-containing protein n=1 Tax=Cercophora newfieldiana TaxID=92897 RepID=A0AA39Y4B4_9PEZI|nr:hypothetical protein B0T16DRAFT_492873 [Cercophora newfieldiana]